MKKIVFQFLILTSIIIGVWYGLQSINWMRIFHVKKMTAETEKKLGELCWDAFKREESEIKKKNTDSFMDSILNRICTSNQFDRSAIKLHIVNSTTINAFALPDNHLVVYSGLITAAKNESEIAGVIAHEIAHMQSNHVMKKLINELGLTAIVSITNSGTGGEIIKKAAQTLSSSAYSRSLETEADEKGTDYLLKANLDTDAYANFFTKIDSLPSLQIPDWISSHPDSKKRAAHIKKYVKGKKHLYVPVTSPQTLEKVKEEIRFML